MKIITPTDGGTYIAAAFAAATDAAADVAGTYARGCSGFSLSKT
jgi:hypothetical protein